LTSFIDKFEGKSIIGKTINSIDRTDGLKITFDNDQWVLLRLSGTEPVARIYVESQTKRELTNWIDDFTDFVTHSKF
jgi:phosphomannomutase